MTKIWPAGIEINAPTPAPFRSILTDDALTLLTQLHRQFEPQRQALMQAREQRQQMLNTGVLPDFLADSQNLRDADWKIAPLPADLQDRRVEIVGPAERHTMINALNAGAAVFMADLEDAQTPSWHNQLDGQINIRDAWQGTLDEPGQNSRTTMMVRPRGWHLMEHHVLIDGQPVNGGLFDFALSAFHSAANLYQRGRTPCYYLPKLECHQEARLWNGIFIATQQALAIPQGTIKATVMIENVLAAFEMDEILYELREHSAGLNAGRWDYLFSCIRHFRHNSEFCLADREQITMRVPFMRSYALLLVKTCHRRGAPAIGGLHAQIPQPHDPAQNDRAITTLRLEKERELRDGYDGSWVAHPAMVPIAYEACHSVMGSQLNQWNQQLDDVWISAADLLNFQPETPITEQGLRNNIQVGIQYLGAWLSGNGCVTIHHQQEEAATAEIARAQIWQWIRSHKGILEDGRKITLNLFRDLAADEINRLQADYGSRWRRQYNVATQLFDLLIAQDEFTEFFTLSAQQYLD